MKSKHLSSPRGLAPKFNLSPLSVAIRASIVGIGLAHGAVQAETIVVDSMSDTGVCTLREAISSANNSVLLENGCTAGSASGTDTITFSNSLLSPYNTITLTGGALDVDGKDIEINASEYGGSIGGITIDAGGNSGVFNVGSSNLTLNNLTITGGSAESSGSGISANNTSIVTLNNSTVSGNSALNGGGIAAYTSSSVTLNNTTVSGNSALRGGGIFVRDSNTVTLVNSTVSGNLAGFDGGGIYANASSNLSLSNSTVLGNSSTARGGGIFGGDSSIVTLDNSTISDNSAGFDGGGIYANTSSSLSLSNSTVSGNTTEDNGGGIYARTFNNVILSNSTISGNSAIEDGGGIFAFASSVTLSNSTVSGNSAIEDGDGIYARNTSSVILNNSIIANSADGDDVFLSEADAYSGSSTVISDSFTIIEEASFGGSRTGDPGLLPLADNGGPTLTHALKAGSIARNSGILTGTEEGFENCTTHDQRGQLRDDGDGKCDVGAIEFNSSDDGSDDSSFFVIPLPNGKAAVIPL